MISGLSSEQNTPLHRLHPFSKMIVGGGFTIFSLFLKSPIALSALLFFLLIVAILARINLSCRRFLGLTVFFSVFAAMNFLVNDDPSHAVTYCLRLAVFMAAVPVMASTTAPQDMARALSRLKLPPGIIVSLLLVWRFFPVMASEIREMQKAAALRGKIAGSALTRFYRGLMVPLAFSVVEYADRISLALEIRGFCPAEKRSCYVMPGFGKGDTLYIIMAVLVSILALGFQWGWLI